MGHRQRLFGRGGPHRLGPGDSPGLGRFFAPYAYTAPFSTFVKDFRPSISNDLAALAGVGA